MNADELLKQWEIYAKKQGVELNKDVDINLKAYACSIYDGACPCLVRWRLECPCPEALEEIKEANACYCMVFKKKGSKIDFEKHSEMTKKVREKLGIGKKK
jgi:ferredoxin-thioredoxin reductase catalytic subunit